MLGTWFMWLTTAAVALLVPATAALFTIARSTHKAAPRGLERHLRVAVAATALGLGAMLVAALLGAGAVGSAAVAVVLAGVVLGNAPSRDGWAVRGVVVRGLAVAAVASGLLGLAYRAVSFGPPLTLLGVQAVLLAVSAVAALRLSPAVDGWVHRRAALGDAGADEPSPPAPRGSGVLLRTGGTAAALGALVLPAAAVAVVTAVSTEEPVADRVAGPEVTGTGVPSAGRSAPQRTGAAGPSRAPSGTPGETVATVTGGSPAVPVTTATSTDVEAPEDDAAEPSDLPSPTATPTDTGTDAGPSPSESPSQPGLTTLIPWPSPEPEETKTPGYAKEKPNRPSDAPSPGNGHG